MIVDKNYHDVDCMTFFGQKKYHLVGFTIGLMLLTYLGPKVNAQTIRYVKASATGTGDASSWENASANLQAVLNASAPGDQVWVAAGIYKPSSCTTCTIEDRSLSFSMKNGVAIYGSFVGTERTLSERPALTNQSQSSASILSGDLGIPGDRSDYSQRIISNTGLDNTAELDGFVITASDLNAPSTDLNRNGGGMRNLNSSPTIRNCFFTNNYGTFGNIGGGLYSDVNSHPVLMNCTFDSNGCPDGAAIYSGPITLTNCIFANNVGQGSAILRSGGNALITNCTFTNNSGNSGPNGASNGGAAAIGSGSTITNCLFTTNYVVGSGGALSVGNSTVINCTFRGNRASSGGAGIQNSSGGAVSCSGTTFVNCSFSGNQANARSQSRGGAVSAGSGTSFINCSFTRNSCNQSGGAVSGSGVTFINSIIWGNAPNGVDPTAINAMTYTDTQDSTSGIGNLSLDPLFVDAPGDNLRLKACSPAIDKGSDEGNTVATDLDGKLRRVRTIDMGPYEFQSTPLPLATIVQQPASIYSIPQAGTLTASVFVSGSVSSYQWYKNEIAITSVSSATTATLLLTDLTPADNGTYRLLITGPCNTISSNSFRLTVNTGMYTLKPGSWDDPTVWSLNRVPINTDAVLLKHIISIPTGYQTHALKVSYDIDQRLSIGNNSKLKLNQ